MLRLMLFLCLKPRALSIVCSSRDNDTFSTAVNDKKSYICIDLKSFFASVECVERGLDPMTAKLVVADPERGDKTICLAVTPALKKLGVPNRCRVFEIPESVGDYIMAEPRMQKYVDYSAAIYKIYLGWFSKHDIHVYSIDEVFIDASDYLDTYGLAPKELAVSIMEEIMAKTGIRSTAGIGTNMYLAKIALDITAKHAPDFIGILDEESYKEKLWDHTPLRDFWHVGPRTQARLEKYGIHTMRDIAETDEDFLYSLFGVNAELLIDHSKGIEPTTMADIKGYKNKSHSLSSGQVLFRDYDFEEAVIIIKEMADNMCLTMAKKGVASQSFTIHVGYSNKLRLPPAHGTVFLDTETNLTSEVVPAVEKLFRRVVDPLSPVRRMFINVNNIHKGLPEKQLSLFSFDTPDIKDMDEIRSAKLLSQESREAGEKRTALDAEMQRAILDIKKKYGKNAILRGLDFEEAATQRERNSQIGGHKDGSKRKN